MNEFFNQFVNWVVDSSTTPQEKSLTIKGILLFAVTQGAGYLVQTLDLVCKFGYHCYTFDPSLVDQAKMIIDNITNGLYFLFSVISIGMAVYGSIRKVYRTASGTNAALQKPDNTVKSIEQNIGLL